MRFAAAAALTLATALPAHGALVAYAGRAAFTADAGPLAIEDFEACAAESVIVNSPVNAVTANDACAAGAIADGVTFVDDPGPDLLSMYIAAPGFTGNASIALGQANPAEDGLNIDLAAPARAVGFTIIQNYGGGDQLAGAAAYRVTVWAGEALLGAFDAAVAPGEGSFWGVVSDTAAITRVRVNNPLAFDTIDDVLFSAEPGTDAAPAPGALALLGLGALAVARRRR